MPDKVPQTDYSAQSLPTDLPILPLFEAALFPKMVLPLVVMQSESIKLVDEAMGRDRIIGLLVSNKSEATRPDPEKDLAKVGCSALILKMAKTDDNRAQMLVQGLSRFHVDAFMEDKAYLRARVTHFEDIENQSDETRALMANMVKQFSRIVEHQRRRTRDKE